MAAPHPKCYRYSISELYEIQTRITTPFDLSRLSFNAVRAGIVKGLSDRVMGPGESAVHTHSRGWSQQTSSASDEQILFQGNPYDGPAIRSPKNAPSSPTVQKTEGFAHFLKTHSSPNHNRVTAGGRIVPMEKRLAPPRFALSASKVNQNTSSAQRIIKPVSRPVRVDTAQFADDSNNFSSSNKNNIFGYHTETSNALVPTVTHGLLPPSSSSINPQQAALESNIMQQNQLISYGQGLGNGTLYPAVTGMTSQTPIFVQRYPVSSPYLPFAAPFVQPTVAIHGLPLAYDTAPSSVSELQARLIKDNHSLEVYQQQLHDLNRYRATHARDDTLAAQRMHIASRRNDTRNEIQRVKASIAFHERLASQQHSVQQQNVGGLPLEIKEPNPSKYETTKAKSASKLNVAAAAYVPRAANPPTATERGLTKFSAARYSKNNNITGSPEQTRVDKWNNRLGDPPPHLLQEQRLQAEHILSKLNAPQVSDDDASENDSAQSSGFTNSDLDAEHRAPPAIEAENERLLDAMRKPIGTTTPVLMSNGRMKVVAGIDLKPQPIEEMTDFEIAYWKRKPSDPDYLGHGDKENSRAPSLIAKTSTLSFESSVLSQDQAKTYRGNLQGSSSRQALSEVSATIGSIPKSLDTRSRNAAWGKALGKTQARAASKGSTAAESNRSILPEPSASSVGQEALLNKTYSSTAIQDIHATASLPRSLDGAVEANLLRVKGDTPKDKSPTSPKSPKSPRPQFFKGFRRTLYGTN